MNRLLPYWEWGSISRKRDLLLWSLFHYKKMAMIFLEFYLTFSMIMETLLKSGSKNFFCEDPIKDTVETAKHTHQCTSHNLKGNTRLSHCNSYLFKISFKNLFFEVEVYMCVWLFWTCFWIFIPLRDSLYVCWFRPHSKLLINVFISHNHSNYHWFKSIGPIALSLLRKVNNLLIEKNSPECA